MLITTVCMTTAAEDNREPWDTMRRGRCNGARSFHWLSTPTRFNVGWLASCTRNAYLCFFCLGLAKHFRGIEFTTLPWVLVARGAVSVITSLRLSLEKPLTTIPDHVHQIDPVD